MKQGSRTLFGNIVAADNGLGCKTLARKQLLDEQFGIVTHQIGGGSDVPAVHPRAPVSQDERALGRVLAAQTPRGPSYDASPPLLRFLVLRYARSSRSDTARSGHRLRLRLRLCPELPGLAAELRPLHRDEHRRGHHQKIQEHREGQERVAARRA